MITDNQVLVLIFKKEITSLSHRLQRIILRIHQYNIRILQKPGPQQFIRDWTIYIRYMYIYMDTTIGGNTTTRQTEMKRSKVCILPSIQWSCIGIPDCMTAEEIRIAVFDNEHIDMLSEIILHSLPSTKGTEKTFSYIGMVSWYWDCNHRWHCNERQKNNTTCGTTRQGTKTAATELYGNREYKPTDTQAHTLDQHECWLTGNGTYHK